LSPPQEPCIPASRVSTSHPVVRAALWTTSSLPMACLGMPSRSIWFRRWPPS
jgi:hypothetical protein